MRFAFITTSRDDGFRVNKTYVFCSFACFNLFYCGGQGDLYVYRPDKRILNKFQPGTYLKQFLRSVKIITPLLILYILNRIFILC